MGLGYIGRTVNKIVAQAQQTAAQQGTAAHGTQVVHTTQTAAAKAKYHTPHHPVTKENRAFVSKYGFGDLKNDQIRQYRDMSAAILKRAAAEDASHPAASLVHHVRDFIRAAGSNSKLRKNLAALHHILNRDKAHLSPRDMNRLMRILGHFPKIDTNSKRARMATVSLAKTASISDSKRAFFNAPNIVKIIVDAKTPPARVGSAAGAMADYLAATQRSDEQLRAADMKLKKLGLWTNGKYQDSRSVQAAHLGQIARSTDPAQTLADNVGKVNHMAAVRQKTVKTETIRRYEKTMKDNFVSPSVARRAAPRLYKYGGPLTPAGMAIMVRIGVDRMGWSIPKATMAWAGKVAGRLYRSTGGVQTPSNIRSKLNLAHLSSPSAEATPPERSAITKIADLVSPTDRSRTGAPDVSGTIADAADFAKADLLADGASMASVAMSIIQGIFTLSQIGYQYRMIAAREKARYGARGFKAAIEVFQQHGPLPPKEAYRQIALEASGSIDPHGKGLKAFQKVFYATYKQLIAVSDPKQAKDLAEAMEWSNEGMPSD